MILTEFGATQHLTLPRRGMPFVPLSFFSAGRKRRIVPARCARLDDVLRCARRHRNVAIVTAGMHAPGLTPRTGKVILLVDMRYTCCRQALSRDHRAEIDRRNDDSRSGNSTPARNTKKPKAARPIRPSYVLRTRPRYEGDPKPASANSVGRGPRTRRRRPRLPAHRRTHPSSLMVNRGSNTSAGSVPRVFAGIHRMMLLLGGTGLSRGGFFRLLLCMSFG